MVSKSLITSLNNIKGLDLNLLLTFEAVYQHRSVTKAAGLLNISPPAISQSLTKLREFFGDPLFVREGKGLVVTTTAESLHALLSEHFHALLDNLNNFSDKNIKSRFVIHATPYAALRILPEIFAMIEKSGINCEIVHLSSDPNFDNAEDILIYRKADIIFDTTSHYGFSTITEPYTVEKAVAICRKDHPRLKDKLTHESMKTEKSTFLNIKSNGLQQTQSDIENYFGERTFSFSSSSLHVNASIVERSDSVSFIPEWFARKFSDIYNFKILDCDFSPQPVNIFMTYNKASLRNNNFVGLLNIIKECKISFK
ncbi:MULTISPECIES: LysR family transcriptional regulator [Lelliottia]|uniref:LysR family transcriptional regulator n=1 Tax=Lelliottia TaxID=1330545 RepID=UPI000F477EE9|nr:LysR family transcriptional regulator [Lelliottia sp. AC1]UQC72229.1 LysR family transcriptional regulator [Lelliottia sp. AC1]